MNFDYLIIGAGSAGCVLANRLTENNQNNVAIFEAGKPSDIWKVNMPLAILYTMHDPKYNYKYYSEPEPHLHNRRLFCPRGKMIGGCSAHNGMVFVRGNPNDYQRWASFGLDDWSYEKVLPYFKKIETWSEGENEYRGGSGILPVNQSKNKNPLFKAFVDSAGEAGYKINNDMNGKEQEGFGMYDVTIHKGERASVSKYYLNPAKKRKNLKVVTNAHVKNIEFDNKKADKVNYWIGNEVITVKANKEVILSSGTIGSPHILQASGIGPGELLKKNNVNVVKDHPGVGMNLTDHLMLRPVYKVKNLESLNDIYYSMTKKFMTGLKYLLFRKGPLTVGASYLCGFVKSDPHLATPNLQFHVSPASTDVLGKGSLHKFTAFTPSITNVRPTSRGSIELKSSDTRVSPKIKMNYLSTDEDREIAGKALKITRNIVMNSKAYKKYEPEEYRPGIHITDNEELAKEAGKFCSTIFHPVSTCRMGSDENAVVSDRLVAHGLKNLRIVDASVMPSITSGNTNAPTIMIAEKGADMILSP